jgi:hypothetical protein
MARLSLKGVYLEKADQISCGSVDCMWRRSFRRCGSAVCRFRVCAIEFVQFVSSLGLSVGSGFQGAS